jgi:hypothetical protein
MGILVPGGTPKNLAASGAVSLSPGQLLGFYVNSTSSGTIIIKDSTDGSAGAISGTITPAVGWHSFPAYCVNGCYATIGATLNVTLFFAAG